MDISLPNARSVFLPQVPENLTDFKAAVEYAFSKRFDNEDAIRTALTAVTTGTIAGVVAIGASTGTAGTMLAYVGTTGWGTIGAGSNSQFLRYDATSVSPVWNTPVGPVDVSASTAGSLLVATAGNWTYYPPSGTVGKVLTINSSTLPSWEIPVGVTQVSAIASDVAIPVSSNITAFTLAKTVVSGHTVFLHAAGMYSGRPGTPFTIGVSFDLFQNATTVQSIQLSQPMIGSGGSSVDIKVPWHLSGIVTGLSGSNTFTIVCRENDNVTTAKVNGTLVAFEF